jgi:hypothetical protein
MNPSTASEFREFLASLFNSECCGRRGLPRQSPVSDPASLRKCALQRCAGPPTMEPSADGPIHPHAPALSGRIRSIVAALIASSRVRISGASWRCSCRSIASMRQGISGLRHLPHIRPTPPRSQPACRAPRHHKVSGRVVERPVGFVRPPAPAWRACDDPRYGNELGVSSRPARSWRSDRVPTPPIPSRVAIVTRLISCSAPGIRPGAN